MASRHSGLGQSGGGGGNSATPRSGCRSGSLTPNLLMLRTVSVNSKRTRPFRQSQTYDENSGEGVEN